MKMITQVHRTSERDAMVVIFFFCQQCIEAMDGGKWIQIEERSIYRAEDEIVSEKRFSGQFW